MSWVSATVACILPSRLRGHGLRILNHWLNRLRGGCSQSCRRNRLYWRSCTYIPLKHRPLLETLTVKLMVPSHCRVHPVKSFHRVPSKSSAKSIVESVTETIITSVVESKIFLVVLQVCLNLFSLSSHLRSSKFLLYRGGDLLLGDRLLERLLGERLIDLDLER